MKCDKNKNDDDDDGDDDDEACISSFQKRLDFF